jgi:hypothetical protein
LEIEAGECLALASCDFQDSFCGYYNTREGDDFDWERGRGKIYDLTGPVTDTSGTKDGYYALSKPPFDIKAGSKAWLVSELFTQQAPGCLNWYMYMYGEYLEKANLSVYVRDLDTKNQTKFRLNKLWTIGVIKS